MRTTHGPAHHRIDVTDLSTWSTPHPGFDPGKDITPTDRPATPTQRLAEATAGAVLHDGPSHPTPARAAHSNTARSGRPADADDRLDRGPYRPRAAPLALLARDRPGQARAAPPATAEPPHDRLQAALWCLVSHPAVLLDAPAIAARAARAARALRGARAEQASAAAGMLALGPVQRHLPAAKARAARAGEKRPGG
ncbi:hypothetical protein ACGFZU_41095 [Streptomyces tendae]|uniref:hypothetical protein n=1 Tax=Streptomyces tendae TaxID=1932 RepID=UPI0037171B01